MKKTILLAAGLLLVNLAPVYGQSVGTLTVNTSTFAPGISSTLTKFTLDFPGGQPAQLVMAIEKAMGKPINVIIADENARVKLPPIKGRDLDIVRLFATLSDNGPKYQPTGHDPELISNYGFKTIDPTPSDDSLWTFYSYSKPQLQTRFSLDFPGGTPAQLVKAIEKAMDKPLNVIINKEDENLELPSLKMSDVFLPQLFAALEAASQKVVAVNNNPAVGASRFGGALSYSQFSSGYGFKCADKNNDNDSSVWYFHVEKPSFPPVVSNERVCQYYSLSPYLDRGFTVDDVTTAIQTGWRMAGESHLPELNYHKETKLLIAFGEPRQLATINTVLAALPESNTPHSETAALRERINELQKKISAPPSNSVPGEKSGK